MSQFGDFTFVVQGPLTLREDPRVKAAHLRSRFPGCAVILSTFKPNAAIGALEADGHVKLAAFSRWICDIEPSFDKVVLSDEPDALPKLKIDSGPNNINRQMASSLAGLREVKTKYAIKLRIDAIVARQELLHRFLEFSAEGERPHAVGSGRILVNSFYTLNPRLDERMLYHVSDWVQVGHVEDLIAFWSAPPFSLQDAVHYLCHPYAPGSTLSERRFLARYAAEQWVTLHYARRKLTAKLDFHNDFDQRRLVEFEDFLVDNFVVFRPESVGIVLPKYDYLNRSVGTEIKCYDHNDWAAMARKRGVNSPYRDPPRAIQRPVLQRAYMTSRPFIHRLRLTRGLLKLAGREL